MHLTPEQLRRIAHLSRIEVSTADLERLGPELAGIFDLIEQLQAVDTTGIVPLSHPLAAIEELPLRLREDVVRETDRREANLAQAPQAENGLFLVPKVLE
ncbi:MAG: Asp-tRNA(Asn)/Glu-tRNA(Gln) amidotransferase subunit GatC [Betaproteobacteria bacterium]|nr:Asp-tRNA(Asn)/Glu-tRNA(Gln) amidotransferase subunit GatC [Betaproteobacteria bacterium]